MDAYHISAIYPTASCMIHQSRCPSSREERAYNASLAILIVSGSHTHRSIQNDIKERLLYTGETQILAV